MMNTLIQLKTFVGGHGLVSCIVSYHACLVHAAAPRLTWDAIEVKDINTKFCIETPEGKGKLPKDLACTEDTEKKCWFLLLCVLRMIS